MTKPARKKSLTDNRLKCIYAKKDGLYGDVLCKDDNENCEYGKGICKRYEEIEEIPTKERK